MKKRSQNFQKLRKFSHNLAPAQRAAGGCSPLKATPGRGPAARRNFFWILIASVEKLMIFGDICQYPRVFSVLFYSILLNIINNVIVINFFVWKMCEGGLKIPQKMKTKNKRKFDKMIEKWKKYFPSRFQHELWTPCPHHIV